MGGVTPCVSYIRYNKKTLPLEMKLIFFFVGNPATRRDRIDPSFFPVCLSPFVSTFSSRKTLWVEWRRISADSAHLLNNPSEIQSCRSFFFYPMHLIIPNSSGNWRMFVCLFVVLIFVCWWMKAQEETLISPSSVSRLFKFQIFLFSR